MTVIPWRQRSEKVADDDVKEGQNHTAVYKKGDLSGLRGEDRKRFQDAKRQRKRTQTAANKLQQMTE